MQSLWTAENVIVWFLLTVGGSFAGSWFGAYLKKKGENYATKEDLGDLVKQMQALTKAQEEIKAEISDKVWDRQRRWELKRDALIDGTKKTGALIDRLTSLEASLHSRGNAIAYDEEALAYVRERAKEWNDAAAEFETAAMVVELVCREHVSREMQQLVRLTRAISSRLTGGELQAFESSVRDLAERLTRLKAVMREELGGIAPG